MIRKHILQVTLLCAGAICNQANPAQIQTQAPEFFMQDFESIQIITFDAPEQNATLTQYFNHMLNISIKDLGQVSLKEIENTYKKLKNCKTSDDIFNAYLKDAAGLSPLFYLVDQEIILDASYLELNEKLVNLLMNSPKKTYLCLDGTFTITPEDKNIICEVRYFDELQNIALFSDIIVEILQDAAIEKLINTKDLSKEEIKKLTSSILGQLIKKLPIGHPLWTFWKDKIVSHTNKIEKFLTALAKNHPKVIENVLDYILDFINKNIDDAEDADAETQEIEQAQEQE